MSLSKLPRELMLDVANNLPTVFLSRLRRTCNSLYLLLWPELTARITYREPRIHCPRMWYHA